MVTIKNEWLSKKVAFNKSYSALSKKSQEDLLGLAILAKESNDQSLLRLFETLPAIDVLKKMKVDKELGKTVKAVAEKGKDEKVAKVKKPGQQKNSNSET